jgi:hypothetical protein
MGSTWQLMLRCIYGQLATGLVGGLFAWAWKDRWHGLAFFAGSALVASGWIISSRFGLKPQRHVAASLAASFAGIVSRWLWVIAGLVIVLGRWKLPALPMVLGLISAQAVFIALGNKNRE